MAAGYRGLPGAFPYAYRSSGSWTLRAYVVLGGLAAAFVGLLFGAGVLALIGRTAGIGGGTFTLSRALFVLVGFLAVAPMVAPVLLVARRHRHGHHDDRYDTALAVAGFCYLVALWLGAVLAAPSGPETPPLLTPAPPLAAVALMIVLHRRYGDRNRE